LTFSGAMLTGTRMLHQAAIKSGLEVPFGSEKVVWSVRVAWLYGVNKEIRGDCLRWEERMGWESWVLFRSLFDSKELMPRLAARVLSKRCTQRKTASSRSLNILDPHPPDHSTGLPSRCEQMVNSEFGESLTNPG